MVVTTRDMPIKYWPFVLLSISSIQVISFFTINIRDLALYLHGGTTNWQIQTVSALGAHKDASHLFSNIASQLLLGVLVEAVHGHTRFLLLYMVTGIGGTLVFRWWYYRTRYPNPVYYVGCSPAVYGIMAAYLAHLLINWKETRYKLAWMFAVIVTLSLEIALYIFDPQPMIAYSSHVGGAVYGILLGIAILRNVRVFWWETRVIYTAFIVSMLFTLVLVFCEPAN
jgi:rhomboid protease GluP